MPDTPTRRQALRRLTTALLSSGVYPLFTAVGGPPTQPGTPDFAPVRRRIGQALAQGEATGVAVAVVHAGRIVWEEGFGWANQAAGLRATPQTPFLASLTKPVTATLLMTLVAEGKLALDEPANTYLGASLLLGTNGPTAAATVRLLGAHAAGLPPLFHQYGPEEAGLAPTPDAVLRDYGQLAFPAGACYDYSNVGFAALGAIATQVTGQDVGKLLTARVLRPLGMQDSVFSPQLAQRPACAVGYDEQGVALPFYITATPASGELFASAHDMARFARFNLAGPASGQQRMLPAHWLGELHRPVLRGSSPVAAAFGWFVARRPSGSPVLFKHGGQPGVSTLLYVLPHEQLACVVLTNRTNGQALAQQVCNQVLTGYLPDWQPPQETVDLPPVAVSVAALPVEVRGSWEGALTGGGAHTRVRLRLVPGEAPTLGMGAQPAVPLRELQREGATYVGQTTGLVDAAEARRTGATELRLKLLPTGGRLVGRILAVGRKPGHAPHALLPFTLTLTRVAE